jgi:signal transduction histidine kinase
MLPRDRVKPPILIPFGLVLLLVVSALLATAYWYEDRARRQDLAAGRLAAQYMLAAEIESHAETLQAALLLLGLDGSLRAAFASGDRERLLAVVAPLFGQMRDRLGVSHFYLVDTSRSVILRAHQPDLHGDVIERASMLRAQQTGRATHGIEIGRLGHLTMRVVQPWYEGGHLIGFLELGHEIRNLASHIHAALGVDVLVMLEPDSTLRAAPGQDPGVGPSGPVLLESSLEEVPVGLVDRILAGESGLLLDDSGRLMYTASLQLFDAAERVIGQVVILRDATELQARFRESLTTVALFVLLAGTMVFGLVYAILGRVERDHRRQREMETQFARLSSEHQRIVQMEKLAEVGRTISEIAHQINNPLVGVINMAQLAEREADDPVRVRELLAEIRSAGDDCHAFVQRMLAFTRLSRIELAPADLSALVRDTIALFAQSTPQCPEIVAGLPDTPVLLDVDAVLVRHALFNLLSNAAAASPPGATVEVTLRPEEGPERAPGWLLSVRDRGPGLPAGTLDRIFEPFFTTRAGGTGLGLAVVRHVAMVHDGTITAANAAGGGARFALWLPATRSRPEAAR